MLYLLNFSFIQAYWSLFFQTIQFFNLHVDTSSNIVDNDKCQIVDNDKCQIDGQFAFRQGQYFTKIKTKLRLC